MKGKNLVSFFRIIQLHYLYDIGDMIKVVCKQEYLILFYNKNRNNNRVGVAISSIKKGNSVKSKTKST